MRRHWTWSPMVEPADDRDDSTNSRGGDTSPYRGDTSDHERRNRTQQELLRPAAERRRHAEYIEAMLRRAASGDRAAVPQTEDAPDEETGGPRRD